MTRTATRPKAEDRHASQSVTVVRHLEEGDRDRVAHLQRQAFLLPPERQAIAGRYPLEQGWVVEDGGVVHGALRVQKLGQLFGGRAVPCAAVSSVKVAAESRGGGYGGALLHDVLSGLRDEGVAVSTLFPVHLGVYRRYGWETAFACQQRRLPLEEATIRGIPDASDYRVVPWDDDDLEDISQFYRGVVGGENGPFDRNDEWWHERVLATRDGREPYRYVARSAHGIGGYLVYTHEPAGANLPYGFELDCRDFLWSDPAAAAAMLAFARSHAGMGHGFRWIGPASDPIEQLLSGLGPSLEKRLVAMCRLIDVSAALESRGYPAALDGRVVLRVADDVLPDNDGTIEIAFAEGAARVTPAGKADAPGIGVHTLAALYTGWLDPSAAASIGLLSGADENTIATLRSAFGGSTPWMAEFY